MSACTKASLGPDTSVINMKPIISSTKGAARMANVTRLRIELCAFDVSSASQCAFTEFLLTDLIKCVLYMDDELLIGVSSTALEFNGRYQVPFGRTTRNASPGPKEGNSIRPANTRSQAMSSRRRQSKTHRRDMDPRDKRTFDSAYKHSSMVSGSQLRNKCKRASR